MIDQIDQHSTGREECNFAPGRGPTVQENVQTHWMFRINAQRFKPEELVSLLAQKSSCFGFQLERGKELTEKNPEGYLHYQGCMTLKTRSRTTAILKWLGMGTHLEPTKSVEAALAYCTKLDTRVGGPWIQQAPVKPAKGKVASKFETAYRIRPVVWRPWQQKCLDIAAGKPDERTVYWFWGSAGGEGKTTLGHELCRNYEGVPVNGELGNILALATEVAKRLYLVIAPRDAKAETFPYQAIELLKDGLWMKGKYEVASVQREELCHVFIFANVEPIYERLTSDRWIVTHLN